MVGARQGAHSTIAYLGWWQGDRVASWQVCAVLTGGGLGGAALVRLHGANLGAQRVLNCMRVGEIGLEVAVPEGKCNQGGRGKMCEIS